MEKIVVWQTAFLGDLVLTSNLLLNLHKNFPDKEIFLVARPFAEDLFFDLPWLRIIPFNKTLKENREIIKKLKGFDLAISPHRSLRTSLSLFLARIKERVGFDKAEFSFLYTKRAKHEWDIHEVERNQRLLRVLGLKIFTQSLHIALKREEIEKVQKKFGLEKPFVVVSPGANFRLKKWIPKNFGLTINYLINKGFNIVLTGTTQDLETAKEVLNFVRKPKYVKNLIGMTSLRELIHIIKLSEFVLTNDSAPTHIANAVNVPAFTVYCATSAYYGFYPRIGFYFEPLGLECHPCSPNPKKCKNKTELCRSSVRPIELIELFENLL
ncbi:MAG: glycosyltransferase family 9 protein [Aquificae bacterium]|nr:glycosyltransferase family 9 protein [Aquificota bacterium]